MTIEQAIISVLELERQVQKHYAQAAEHTNDPAGKDLFTILANEEQGHINYLEAQLKTWRETGRIDAGKLTSILPSKEWLDKGKIKMCKIAFDKDYSSEIAQLKDALKFERQISEFYQKLIATLGSEGAALFAPFLRIEENHLALVQGELDALQKDGFWFDISEFNLEAG